MHVGDICNLGIFCIPRTASNRNLLDFIQETIDPTTGCAHIAYADDNTVKKMRVANQTSGCLPLAALQSVPGTPAPTTTTAAGAIPNTSAAVGTGGGVAAAAALLCLALLAPRRRHRSR